MWLQPPLRFRPLDGESISKRKELLSDKEKWCGFRPLDGESISKPATLNTNSISISCFRPLDGESISKHLATLLVNWWEMLVSVP